MRLFSRTPQIDAARAAELVSARDAVVVDVRSRSEWTTGHIEGALHIPLPQLGRRLREVPTGKTVVAVCRSGHRSTLAARTLAAAGREAFSLRGGMKAWGRTELPLTKSDRSEGRDGR